MEFTTQHAPFIIGSYAAVVVVVAGLIAWLIIDARRQRRLLADLDARGVKRRSAQSGGPGTAA